MFDCIEVPLLEGEYSYEIDIRKGKLVVSELSYTCITFGSYEQLQESLNCNARTTAVIWDALAAGKLTDGDVADLVGIERGYKKRCGDVFYPLKNVRN